MSLINVTVPESNPEPIRQWVKRLVIKVSDKPGRLYLDEYQLVILEAMADFNIPKVTLMVCSQYGKSMLIAILLMWYIDQCPQRVYYLTASVKTLRKFLREKLNPMLLSNPSINAKVKRNQQRNISEEGFTTVDGMYVTFATSGSRSDSHGSSASVAIGDETDDWAAQTTVSDMDQRLSGTGLAKRILASTPDYEGESTIEAEYYDGSQSMWLAACPFCFDEQRPNGVSMFWRLVDESEAVVRCEHCGTNWDEDARKKALARGYVHNENESSSEHLSFWCNILVSPRTSLDRALEAKAKYPEKKFCTQMLGWPFAGEELKSPDPSVVTRVSECPFEPVFTVVGGDVQGDRIEYYVVAFDEFLVNKHVLHTNSINRTEGPETFVELRKQITKYKPQRIVFDGSYSFEWVDAGLRHAFEEFFYNKDPIVEIVRGYPGNSFDMPLRGAKRAGYFRGATDEAKVLVYQDVISGRLTVSDDIPEARVKQLVSERLLKRETKTGKIERYWDLPTNAHNEFLDCVVYAYIGAVQVDVGELLAPTMEYRIA